MCSLSQDLQGCAKYTRILRVLSIVFSQKWSSTNRLDRCHNTSKKGSVYVHISQLGHWEYMGRVVTTKEDISEEGLSHYLVVCSFERKSSKASANSKIDTPSHVAPSTLS